MENKTKEVIRVLVVEDSPLLCKVLTNILNDDSEIAVVGVAHNGNEAVKMVTRLEPDLITMDIHMPTMDGLEATRQIMALNPTPILIISTSTLKSEMGRVFEAISCGALDVIDKSSLEITDGVILGKTLIEQVKLLKGIKVIRHPLANLKKKHDEVRVEVLKTSMEKDITKIVAIAASTGGPQALRVLLGNFPKDFPSSIVMVQHITSGFDRGLAEWLDYDTQISVKIAEDSEEMRPGVAYLAPCDVHMRVERKNGVGRGRIKLSNEPAFDGQKPSGDVLIESVAGAYKEGAIGVVLTGMGRDGATGMKSIKHMNGQTIAQDEESCAIFGMPKTAIKMGVVDKVLPLKKIAGEIINMLRAN